MDDVKKRRRGNPALWGPIAMLALLLVPAVVYACVAPADGTAGGLRVGPAATILRGAATDIETWDLNGDGVLDSAERAGLYSAVAARFTAAVLAGR